MEHHTEARQYMVAHQLPQLLESILATVVPFKAKRPEQVIDRLPFICRPDPDQKAPAEGGRAFDDRLDTLLFNIFEDLECGTDDTPASRAALSQMCVEIFERHGVCATLRTDVLTLRKWVELVQANYHPEVPFHNFWHAANVLQTLHAFLAPTHNGGCGSRDALGLTPLETAALLFAAVCHDLQHPGRDNSFLINTTDPLAVRYNDKAVLEQHHCASAFNVAAAAPAADILSGIKGGVRPLNVAAVGPALAPLPSQSAGSAWDGAEEYRAFRKIVVQCILATEVASHKKHVEALQTVVDGGYDKDNAEHRLCAMAALVEAADISNESRTFNFSQLWAPRVQAEFWAQGDVERQLGIPVPKMRSRGETKVAQEQQGFINFLVRPLYVQLVRVVPRMKQCLENMDDNVRSWQTQLE